MRITKILFDFHLICKYRLKPLNNVPREIFICFIYQILLKFLIALWQNFRQNRFTGNIQPNFLNF